MVQARSNITHKTYAASRMTQNIISHSKVEVAKRLAGVRFIESFSGSDSLATVYCGVSLKTALDPAYDYIIYVFL